MGREATVSWPGPDLVFRNDTDTAAVITTDYTGSSITVRIFGTDGGRTVRATEPEVVSRDAHGFTVLVERIVRQGADVVRRDTFRTFYRYE
jgi:vancomycin resistance protein YoaR